jgi:biopolymer transport protein ExbB
MIIIERIVTLGKVRKESALIFNSVFDKLKENKVEEALLLCEEKSDLISAKIIKAALINIGKTHQEIQEALDDAGERELSKLERFLPSLGTIISVSPMLGLLGTVTGMIKSSNVLAKLGTGDPLKLIGGISEALITTAFGLIVAIPALVAYNFLIQRSRNAISGISKKSAELVQMVAKDFKK